VLKRAVFFSEASGGSFDITAAPLVALWGIGKKGTFIPETSEIEAAKALVGYRDIIIDEENSRVMLRRRGQRINLGGIAKGFTADAVKDTLLSYGIDSALVNLGGNVAAIGSKPGGEPWTIGIQDPTKPTGAYIGVVEVRDKTLVTSGANEQFFIHGGVRYHHIIDPRTGMPADTGLLSVTAIGGCSMDMDALTTAVFVLGMEKGMELLQRFGAQAVFVKTNGEVYVTEGLRASFLRKNNIIQV
jgi:thiamine biosynthesis lipoprotein